MLTQALLRCTVALLDDACPFDPRFYRCGLLEDDLSEDSCAECWRAYLYGSLRPPTPTPATGPNPCRHRRQSTGCAWPFRRAAKKILNLAPQGFDGSIRPHNG